MASIEWNQQCEEKLIELWKENPCLFDTASKDFSNRNARRQAIEAIGFSLEKPADEVNKKIRNFRTQSSRAVRMLPSGSGRRGGTAHQLWIKTQLEFLRQHVKARESSSSFQLSSLDEGTQSEEMGQSSDDDTSLNMSTESTTVLTLQPSKKHLGPHQRKKMKQSNTEAILESIADSLAKPIQLPLETELDIDAIFGQYIASRLRQINDVRIKTNLIATLNQAISEAEIASLDYQNPVYYAM